MKANRGAHLVQNPLQQLGVPLGLRTPQVMAKVTRMAALLQCVENNTVLALDGSGSGTLLNDELVSETTDKRW